MTTIRPWRLRKMAALRSRLGLLRYEMLQVSMEVAEINRRGLALGRELREITATSPQLSTVERRDV